MTGVSSRRWLERHLDELASSDDSGATLMLDVDLFKIVNDTYGHHVGDDVLGVMGTILREETDDAALARFGGEEFVVVLPGRNDHQAHETAERIRRRVETHEWDTVAPGLRLTISVGVSAGRLCDVRRLLISADEALLDAKRRGRNRTTSALARLFD